MENLNKKVATILDGLEHRIVGNKVLIAEKREFFRSLNRLKNAGIQCRIADPVHEGDNIILLTDTMGNLI